MMTVDHNKNTQGGLVIEIREGEWFTVGDAIFVVKEATMGKLRLVIKAPKELEIKRQNYQKKTL